MTAEETLELGLVNRIISTDNFASECIQVAKQMSQISRTVIETTKSLTYRFQDELEEYFNTEAKMMRLG
ncbi:MAG TPA: hypothetical protein EYQ43_07885 [Methyloprofundus sp.]|nr:hypothetical protein [Methyloprofundus sp.]